MVESTRFDGAPALLCHWCRETVLLVDVDKDHVANESAPSTSCSEIAEPLCEACFEEISKILSRGIRDRAPDDDRGLPRPPGRRQEDSQHGSSLEIHEKRRQLETLNGLISVETKYWQAYSSLHLHLLNVADVRDTLQRKMERTEQHLAKISAGKGVYRYEYFKIEKPTSSCLIGTINGFRLGTLSTEQVDWWELNTAWGIAVLLLEQLRIEIVTPMSTKHKKCFWVEDIGAVSWVVHGSYPRVIAPSATYELVGPVSKIFCLSYDRALILFVKCLDVIGKALEVRVGEKPPHEISSSGDRIGGTSVRYGLSRDSTWTLALKRVLENLDWCLGSCRLNL